MTTAFDPFDLSGLPLANRIAMAPMTRSRAHGPSGSPTDLTARYYAQRATAGLIITEGIQPSAVGQGYPNTPGLHTEQQIAAWRTVTDAVHAEGGVIFAQLMHTGRVGHPSLLPDGLTPVGASPVAAAGQVYTADGPRDFVTPRELTDTEITATIADFAAAARSAVAAGFDGAEVHGANGYLLHQFLSTNANRRTDRWGGSSANRIRLTVETTLAVADAIGAHRTGLRISPANAFNDITEDDHRSTYQALIDALDPSGLAYLHISEAGDRDLTLELRKRWNGALILNPHTPGTITGPDQLALITDGTTDLISFGGLFLANPDLPARLAAGGPYTAPDPATFYGGDHRGYTDYPALTA
ncbi:N-ethylmaleimide reductase [Actinocorallia herbida]|uniref:N-ethylmaleimide reductase n=1 Tax=Actinocorallia herbida TaxID=58109 RepID=A0A3N1D181_9ACTN|nr:alkene reductase [Actinocorallia herbida]ROO87293.1 N-ethylmaleimide reductase [Actinocorallia herbida]